MTWRGSFVSTGLLLGAVLAATHVGAGPDRDRALGGLSAPQRTASGSEEIARQAAILGVPEEKLLQLQRSCREAGFTAEEFSRLMTLVTRAKLAGLPDEQLLNKLEEGLAKRAMPDKVLHALEARARRLSDAKELVDQLIVQGWLAPDYPVAVAMVADTLGAGASPAEVVRAVRDGTPAVVGVPDVRQAFQPPVGGDQ